MGPIIINPNYNFDVQINGKKYKLAYHHEVVKSFEVYTIFVESPELQNHVGACFTILYPDRQSDNFQYGITKIGDIDEEEIKKEAAVEITRIRLFKK